MGSNIEDMIDRRVDERVALILGDARTIVPMWLSPKEAATYTDISVKKLEAMRADGTGPEFAQRGRLIRYPRGGLDVWMMEAVR